MDLISLIKKHSVSGPRYTSYPTAPAWREEQKGDAYKEVLSTEVTDPNRPLALYVHVPFCEQLCYYCGCNIHITKDHDRSLPYLGAVMTELGMVAKTLGGRRTLHQISWGGGTPTFLTPEEIVKLHTRTRECFDIAPDAEVSIEIDPRVTTKAHLDTLRGLGFNRVSLGVQDFNPETQKAINRIQPREMTQDTIEYARKLGFRGINIDLIYGLPFQTLESFSATVNAIFEVKPDRIALYNYAHLPNMIKHQKILDKYPMPPPEERVDIFSMAYDALTHHDFKAIGMDHFARQDDELYKAIGSGTLYRNFMGYTVKRGADMIGVGVSAISELGSAYFQNTRLAKEYEESIEAGRFASFRGMRLSGDDQRRKWVIQTLMCQFTLSYDEYAKKFGEDFEGYFAEELPRLDPFYVDEILTRADRRIDVTELGRLFIRNVAMVFDAYLKTSKVQFSKTV